MTPHTETQPSQTSSSETNTKTFGQRVYDRIADLYSTSPIIESPAGRIIIDRLMPDQESCSDFSLAIFAHGSESPLETYKLTPDSAVPLSCTVLPSSDTLILEALANPKLVEISEQYRFALLYRVHNFVNTQVEQSKKR